MRRFVLCVFVFSLFAIAGAANPFAQAACDRACLRMLAAV
jgi:hypothetical protein